VFVHRGFHLPLKLFRRVAEGLSAKREYRGQPGARVYAVGDIHGRLDLLDQLLGQIEDDIVDRPVERAALVFLGDLIDRGPDSAGVIQRLRTLDGFPAKTSFLLGNHEEMFLRAIDGEPGIAHDWLRFGGDACVESYGLPPFALEAVEEDRLGRLLTEAVPSEHVAFLRGFGDSISFGDYLFVHAGIRPGIAIEDQDPHDLRWIRRPFLSDIQDHGCMVVHGHTITDGVEERSNRIGIDTGAYQSGVLTAIAIEDDQRWYLATGG
jgi:serine/threonine protein phosphatase 1